MERMEVRDVPPERVGFYRTLATDLGGQVAGIIAEDDGEFTIVILLPKEQQLATA